MPIFKSKNTLIITNLKVMSSSLKDTKNLPRLSRKSFIKLYYFIFSKSINKVLLVRHPYRRVVSVYENAFKYYNKENKVMKLHRLYLKTLYPEKNIEDLNLLDVLHSVTIDEFLRLLKDFNTLDAHTVPQNKILDSFYLKLKNVRVIKIEDKSELYSFFESLNLILPHSNKTKSKKVLVLKEDQKKIIYDIYKNDFENFNFQA